MIEKKTILDQIEITRNGTVQARFGLLLVEGGEQLSSKWHRTAFPPGHDVLTQLAVVNVHLDQMGYPPVTAEDAHRVSQFCNTAWAPDILATYQRAQEKVQ